MWILLAVNIVIFIGICFLSRKKPMEALLLLPFAIAIMFLSVMAYYEGEPEPAGFAILLLPLILLPLSTFLIYRNSSTSPSGTPWYGTVAIVILTIFKYTLILALFIAVFQFFSPIIIIIFLAGVYQYYQARKYGLMMDIISTIGTSMRQSLPLPMALTTAAYGQKRKEARIFNNIAHWLAQGWPLSEALRRGYWRCPSHILGAIATAEQMDQLPKAIESLQVDLSEKLNNYKTAKPVHPWYPVIVLIVISSIMTGLSIYIIPTFSEVLYDMSEGQASLPAATQSLLDFSSWMIGRKGLNALLVLTLFFWVIAFLIYSRFRRRTPCSPHFLSLIGDRIKWYTPVLHWFEKTFGNLYLVQSLRVGLLAGYPVNIILRNASGLDVNRCYQERLQKWLKKIEAGDNIAQSAKACGLDKTLCWAFDEKVNKGNTPQILEGLEEVYRNKYNYRKNVLSAASWPLVILCMGLAVGWVVYAMFIAVFSTITVTLQYTIPQ